MLSPELLIAAILLAAVIIYALTGGSDYGGGMWDLLARGPRARAQRLAISNAIAPIWEANHVWLILVIVLLFTAFPPAFALNHDHIERPHDPGADRHRPARIGVCVPALCRG